MEEGSQNVPSQGESHKSTSKLLSMKGSRRNYTRGKEAEGSQEASALTTNKAISTPTKAAVYGLGQRGVSLVSLYAGGSHDSAN